MAITEDRDTWSLGKRLLYLGFLCVFSLAFFYLTRDNPFWNPGDFLYLNQAIDIGESAAEILTVAPKQPFQPLVNLVFHIEYSLFGLHAWKYYLFNVFIHSLNAFLVATLVFVLLKDRVIAVVSSLLFACAVGNYGKAVMVVSGVSDLLITLLTLLTLFFYFKNQLECGGKILSKWFLIGAICFVLSVMTKTTSFVILGCMLAFAVFFRTETKRPVFSPPLLVFAVIALTALLVKFALGFEVAAQHDFVFGPFGFLKNYASYLVRMVFPIHTSTLVRHAGPVVYSIYEAADAIRLLVFITIVSFSLFGFVFGNRTLRFFIAWTYITVTPFCFFEFPKYATDWLDIRHLYLVSVGFSMVLASVTVLASRLLWRHRWRRALPYTLPLAFVVLSQFIIYQLDTKYELTAEIPEIRKMAEEVRIRHEASQRGE